MHGVRKKRKPSCTHTLLSLVRAEPGVLRYPLWQRHRKPTVRGRRGDVRVPTGLQMPQVAYKVHLIRMLILEPSLNKYN